MGAYTEIVDFTFTANETSRTFSGLSITKDDFYKVVFTHVNGSASACTVRLLANSSTNANYHIQGLFGAGSSTGAFRINENRIARTTGSQTSTVIGYLKLSENDRFNIFINTPFENTSSLSNQFWYTTSSGATFTSGISLFNLQASENNGLGTGSRIQIYKLAAEKVADITVASNTTQVDISSLSIDKDSEYLLVSDILTGGNASTYSITPNDLTTLSGYHSQRIRGDGSTASATRFNSPFFLSTNANIRTMSHTHIKLSNISAYTAQSYNIDQVGTSNVLLQNFFISSVAENITSITKLNIISGSANNIATGSRFTLYKLYE